MNSPFKGTLQRVLKFHIERLIEFVITYRKFYNRYAVSEWVKDKFIHRVTQYHDVKYHKIYIDTNSFIAFQIEIYLSCLEYLAIIILG